VESASYGVAQICRNGHVVTSDLQLSPEMSVNFCRQCGQSTLSACENCGASIRGYYSVPGVFSSRPYSVPAFCHNCGHAYPWTAGRLQAARDLAQEVEGVSPEERDLLTGSLEDLVRDTPNTPVAATRFKRIAAKTGQAAAQAFRSILVDVVSETAKKMLWP
jgi:hypothetical protein